MSRDTYQLDLHKHGNVHVDRYNRQGMLVGRYRLDKTPICHKGKLPPHIPLSDYTKFAAVLRDTKI